MPLDAIKSTCFWMASGRWGRHREDRDRKPEELGDGSSRNPNSSRKHGEGNFFFGGVFHGLRMLIVQFQCENSIVAFFENVL